MIDKVRRCEQCNVADLKMKIVEVTMMGAKMEMTCEKMTATDGDGDDKAGGGDARDAVGSSRSQ